MSESQLQRVYNYRIYLKDAKIYSGEGFVKLEDGSQAGTHWTVFYVKNNKLFYFDSFGGAPDNFIVNQLPKPIIYHNFKIQDIDSKICGSYCLYSCYLTDRMKHYDTILKMYFGFMNADNCFWKLVFTW